MDERHDVVIVGGGAAGLAGAVALARSRRSVLVVDSGDPRNGPAAHVHNFLGSDGVPPGDILATGRAEVVKYGGFIQAGEVTTVRRAGDGFRVDIGGRFVDARRLLVATGSRDELPDIPGLAERWGIDVLHCPYCHGWEVRDRRIGVLATGPLAAHQALLFRQLSPRVTVLEHLPQALSDEQRDQLHAVGIGMVGSAVIEVESDSAGLTGVRLADDRSLPLDALVVAPTVAARGELLASLGLRPVEVLAGAHVLGTRIEADATGATDVPGVWVAGNVADIQAQVVSAAAAGLSAGAAINVDLIAEETQSAVERHRSSPVHGEQAWEERYRASPQTWSGNPNSVLVAEAADLTPGAALDAGSGEGADALWLAGEGWQVTAAELSTTALDRARAQGGELRLEVNWLHTDLVRDSPPGSYDLVSSFFLHLPAAERRMLWRNLAGAVAPGGTLLVVGHDLSDLETTMPRPALTETGWTAGEVADYLGAGWTIVVAEARPREAPHPDGRVVTIHDAVLRARRDAADLDAR
ncbi:MAG: NAD(P)/FAD-dependent oxidoreductase [Propionibacteriales bacterium]|nr:NAD(P)/FAD-dependent oxidoreductase [Propionibacteriales bacterium]